MFTRLLTALEKKRINAYLKADGKRTTSIAQLVSRARQHLPRIEDDRQLLLTLIERYDKAKSR